MKFKFLPMMVLAAIPFLGNAQRNCGTMENHQQLLQQDPAMQSRMDQIEAQTRDYERQHRSDKVTGIVYTIPVVVHVVYNGSTQNIPDAQVLSQIDVLNKDFRLLNPDNVNVPSIFAGLKSDVEINFCLAQRDPNGQPTNGITRTATTVASFGTNNSVKSSASGGKDAWNTSQYLNMWVCNIGGGILGYAQFPGGAASTDGVVMDYRYFGLSGTANAPFNLGRTATHEVGHWLNLRHIWGDATCGSDQVNDTPTHNTANYGCPGAGHRSTCTGTPEEMWMNYMDYSDDACMYMFSADQTTRMRALFATGGARVSLLSSQGCTPPTATCGTPTGLNTTGITNTSATLNWTAVSGATSYNVQYRTSSATTFTTVSSTTNSFNLTSLTLGTSYVYQVSAVCASGSSPYSSQATFTTTGGTCGVPTGISSSGITATGATISWAAVSGATSYDVQYRTSAATTFTTVSSTTTSTTLSGLTASTAYVYNVRAVCPGTAGGAWSAQGTFTTSAAGTTYCTSRGNSVADEWIDRVSLNNLTRTSAGDGGYIYFTGTTANVVANTSYSLGYSAGFRSGYTATQNWRIWIDYNRNGVFTDAGELVVSRSSSSASNLSTSIRIPSTARNGVTRMRVSMKWNSAQTSSCETFSYGEVEDYNVNISGGVNREAGMPEGSEEVFAENTLELFPNPASDRLIITRSMAGWMNGASLMVVDMQGKIWRNESLSYEEGRDEMELNTSQLPNGLYNLVIFTGSEKVSKRVMILHP